MRSSFALSLLALLCACGAPPSPPVSRDVIVEASLDAALDAPRDSARETAADAFVMPMPDAPMCAAGQTLCGLRCTDLTSDPQRCGACDRPCPSPPHTTNVRCATSTCFFDCADGFHECTGVCIANSDPTACGRRCLPCFAPDNADPTCVSDACGFACRAGFTRCGATCAPTDTFCDDGNTAAGDGCAPTCVTEAGYTCTGTPSVCTMM